MDIKIWFFSGSGQCASLAKQLTKRLSAGNKVSLLNITSSQSRELAEKDIDSGQFILIFPIYANDVPNVLVSFLETLHSSQTPVMLFALWGRCHKGTALFHAREILAQRGFIVNGAAEICAEHTYLLDRFPCEFDSVQAERAAEYAAGRLANMTAVFPEKNSTSPLIYLMSALPDGAVTRRVTSLMLNEALCTGCAVCRKACAAGAIKDDMSINEAECIRCLACVSACPEKARKFTAKSIARFALGRHYKENIDAEDRFY